jgi:hypothetical protein
MFEFVAPRTSISFVYLLFHFDLSGVRCINISKWPQSIVSSDDSSDGDAAILPFGNREERAEPHRMCGTCSVGAGPLRCG